MEKIAYVLSSMLENAKQMGIISSNPCRNVKLNFTCEIQDEIHYFDKHQYIQILQLLSHETLEHQTIIELALKTGMRRSEMFGLTYNDIDFINNSISINKSRHRITGQGMQTKSTKTKNSVRVIAIPQSLTALLLKYKSKYPHNEYIFDNLSIDGISQWWRKFQIKNHFKNIRFHDLRHTHATLLLLQGVDLKTIQHRLGHADISITMSVYAHVCQELDVNACTKLDALEK